MKTILLVVAQKDYQPLEYGVPKDVLESNGVKVITVSNQTGVANSVGNFNSVKVDLSLADVDVSEFDGLFFCWWFRGLEYLDIMKGVTIYLENGKKLETLWGNLHSPRILAKAGVLKNKKATGWNGDGEFGDILSKNGAIYIIILV
jgi:protease I